MTAMHPLTFNDLGCLPMGRHVVTMEEARSYSGLPDPSHRQALWDDFETLTSQVRGAVGRVPACWLGGSYFTDKTQPGDIDVVYLLDYEDVVACDDEAKKFLNFLRGKRVKTYLGLQIDGFFIPWWPASGPGAGSADRGVHYLQSRGYWDDLWSRLRDDEPLVDGLPRRGYLEVIVDGYERP